MSVGDKKYIAQFGSFDVKNYGDLLFPDIIGKEFLDYNIHLFSPNGGNKPFSDKEVFPCDEFENMVQKYEYKAVIIGGGDIIRLDNYILTQYSSGLEPAIAMWQLPCIIAAQNNIPILFNGVGVPFSFRPECRNLVKYIFDLADYISVRDEVSKKYLEECGVKNISVVPDTVFKIKEVYDVDYLTQISRQILEKYGILADKEYIVFQHNIVNENDERYMQYLCHTLQEYSEKTNKKIVFMPIGYVHKDEQFMRKLFSMVNSNCHYIDEELNLEQMTAILACSSGYVGTSMHGAIVTLSYGKFAICMNDMNLAKIDGLYGKIGKDAWNIKNKYNLDKILLDQSLEESIKLNFSSDIEDHFMKMRKTILNPLKEKKNDIEILNIFYRLALKQNDKDENLLKCANVYYDLGEGYSEKNKIQVYYENENDEYQLNVDVLEGTEKIGLDPIEDNIVCMSNFKALLDGEKAETVCDSELKTEEGAVLLSLDPKIEIKVCGQEKLYVSFKAKILDQEALVDLIGTINYSLLLKKEELSYKKQDNERLISEKQVLNKENEVINEKNQELVVEVETLSIDNRKKEEQIEYIHSRIKNVNQKLDSRNEDYKKLEEYNLQLQGEVDRLNNEVNSSYIAVETMRSSTSWKITKPIRGVKTLVRKVFTSNSFFRHVWRAAGLWKNHGFSVMRQEYEQYKLRKKNGIAMPTDIPVMAPSNNKDGYIPYDSEYQENIDFSAYNTDVKMLAFYLPQYHTFKENDEWWGEGFTEWVNVRKGTPRFSGHYQPRVPHQDIGYYCLDDINVLKQQAKLAKQHGIYGFCFYYYWFSGKRLMEKPVDMLLEHPEIDLPFCLCWANENWTRTWDGQAKNVLIGQEYSYEDDELFIKDICKYVNDPRYIKIDGKAVIIAYNPGEIPDCEHTFKQWRRYAKEYGLGEILIWTCQTANHTAEELNIQDYIDAEVEFPPHNTWKPEFAVRDVDLGGGSAFIYNYDKVVDYQIEKMEKEKNAKVPVHHCCTMGWDNSARRKENWFAYYGYSLKSLYKWVLSLAKTAREQLKEEERFVFINAWNEWGEGTYLDPDRRYGYANINTVSKALHSLPYDNKLRVIHGDTEDAAYIEREDGTSRIAVQIHMFYLDTLDEIVENLNKIPYRYDCYISTDTEEKKKNIRAKFEQDCTCKYCQVDILKNRGRDVAPFLVQMKKVYKKYDYMCHIHSKKTKTNDHGNEWRKYIFDHVFGNETYMRRVFSLFENNSNLGIVMPETYPVLELQAEWGGNREGVQALLTKMGIDMELPEEPIFPVGDMFWMRTKAVEPIFDLNLSQADFPEEAGQVNATIAHQIERVWVYMAKSQGYDYVKVFNACSRHLAMPDKKKIAIYVHYDKENVISAEDQESILYFAQIFDEIHFVTNSDLAETELKKIEDSVTSVMKRPNIGLDFAGWKQKLEELGKDYILKFDELVLLNNSFYKPIYNLTEMFCTMEQRKLDFWGATVFPYSPDGTYINKPDIPEHLQSYFMVFNHDVIESNVFWEFFENMPVYKTFIDVVANCESQFTRILADAGFKYEPYIRETYYISRFLNNYRIPYEKPVALVLLKDPFVKKKCLQYMSESERIKLMKLIEELQA